MKVLKFLIPLGIFVVLVGFLGVGLKLDPREVPSPLIGKPAPAFELTRLDQPEQKIRRDDLLGKVWVLNVWASWCAPCREEHPLVVAFAKKKLAPVYGLNYKDQRNAGLGFLRQLGDPYEASLFDADGRVGIDYGVYGVPETFVVDKQGIIRFKHIGPLNPDVLRDKIEPLVKELNA
ncbi:MAG: DsbE family thiol:disulfide interchange protein [Piscinibacter sp.]|uniref:DsbE family thiol:disulfide interchange protein n=1 Tax=Piscinibacter TaxID=1114981 RepID=UPI000FDE336E|nr:MULTISPECIES: DsbE family thiol:disulfide interchange protein [Piscinibacter]MCW5663541.1 DsbE family thiol:disulfide interchange protein [Piscinibacter sp.]